jgi:phospholipid/cholesterol/gamma-HCH transport system substrate-binding protein
VSDYETAQKRRNITVGIFAAIALVALAWLIYKFEDMPVRVSGIRSFQVFVQFPTAAGVQENTPVRFCGYQIGKVARIRPPEILRDLNTSRYYHQATVILNIEKKYDNIPASVEVKLMTRGLGSSYIEFRPRPFDANESSGEFLSDKSLLQGLTGMTSEFFPEESQKKLEELVDGLKTFVTNANEILGDRTNKENIKTTLANLSQATDQATKTLKELQTFSAAGTKTLTNTETGVQRVFDAMVDMSDELRKTSIEMRQILEKINSGQGTAGKLVNDGRLYDNLLENSQQLDALLEELKVFMAELPEKGLPIKMK